jgi:apolipoprotein N-acyltransferase
LYLLRSTNTGVSAVIDPAGRIVAASDLDHAETVVDEVAWLEGGTVYQALGDWFAWGAVGLTGLFTLLAFVKKGGGGKRGGGRAKKRTAATKA